MSLQQAQRIAKTLRRTHRVIEHPGVADRHLARRLQAEREVASRLYPTAHAVKRLPDADASLERQGPQLHDCAVEARVTRQDVRKRAGESYGARCNRFQVASNGESCSAQWQAGLGSIRKSTQLHSEPLRW